MRWIAIATALGIVAIWVAIQWFPRSEASAEAIIDRPVAHLQEVRSVALDGQQLPHARLREVLATVPGQELDRARLQRDREAMEHRLAELGYLAARVDPAIVTFDKAGAAYVTFAIDQGKPFHLRTVEVTGAGRDATVVTLTPGDHAVRDRIESAREALTDALDRRTDSRANGRADSRANGRADSRANGRADSRANAGADSRAGNRDREDAGDRPASVELSVRTDLAAAAVDVTFTTR